MTVYTAIRIARVLAKRIIQGPKPQEPGKIDLPDDPVPVPQPNPGPFVPPKPAPMPVPDSGPACMEDFKIIAPGGRCIEATTIVRAAGLPAYPGSLVNIGLRNPERSNLASRIGGLGWLAAASFLHCAKKDPEVAAIVANTPSYFKTLFPAWWVGKSYFETGGTYKTDALNTTSGYDDYGLWQIIRKSGGAGAKRANACLPISPVSWSVPGTPVFEQAVIAGSLAVGFFDMMDARLAVNSAGDIVVNGSGQLAKVWHTRLSRIDSALTSFLTVRGVQHSPDQFQAMRLLTVLDASWGAGPGIAKPNDDVWVKPSVKRKGTTYITRASSRVVATHAIATGQQNKDEVANTIISSIAGR